MIIEAGVCSLVMAAKLGDSVPSTLGHYIVNTISDFAKDKPSNGGEGMYTNIATKGIYMMIYGASIKGRLCLDEKDIQGQVYTILSNSETSQVIEIVPETKHSNE